MTLFVTHDVRVAPGTSLARDRALPTIPNEQTWKSPFLDRVGEMVQGYSLAGGLIGVAGGMTGAVLARKAGRGVAKSGVWALAGAALSIAGAGLILNKLRPDQNRQSAGYRQGQNAQAPATEIKNPGEKVRMMSYNVRGGMGPKGFGSTDADYDKLAKMIREERPDILVLQEVDRFAMRSDFDDTLNELAKRLGADSAVVSYTGTLVTGRQQGCAVLTFNGFRIANARGIIMDDPEGSGTMRRFKGWLQLVKGAIEQKTGDHKEKPSELTQYSPREAIDAMVVTPGGNDVRVLSHHFGGLTAKMDYQAHQLPPYAAALGAWDGATLVGGDFNIHSDTATGVRERSMLGEAHLTDAFLDVGIEPGDDRRKTTPGGGRIDRIYRSSHITTKDIHVVKEEKMASDHFAVSAEFVLGKKQD